MIDDVKAALSGMLSPERRENFIGYAEIREVFNITKYGKVAGCMITEGVVKRGAKVRLLRENVVIHEGTLKTLKRFKDEVKEVKGGLRVRHGVRELRRHSRGRHDRVLRNSGIRAFLSKPMRQAKHRPPKARAHKSIIFSIIPAKIGMMA